MTNELLMDNDFPFDFVECRNTPLWQSDFGLKKFKHK